jgi:hypothetical protein
VKKQRRAGLEAQRKAAKGELGPTALKPPTKLLEQLKEPPKSVGDLLLTLSITAAALLDGKISKGEAETVVDICKFQQRLLDSTEGGDRAELLAAAAGAGITREEAMGLSDDELAARVFSNLGNPMDGPPS